MGGRLNICGLATALGLLDSIRHWCHACESYTLLVSLGFPEMILECIPNLSSPCLGTSEMVCRVGNVI